MTTEKKSVATFEIFYTRFLDAQGQLTQALPPSLSDPSQLLALYHSMVKTRVFDTKAIALQRTGKLGTYPSTLGQEAIGTGIGAAMLPEDVLCPYYREYGAQFWRGVRMEDILRYWGGDERGSDFEKAKEDFPIAVPIGSQTLHAAGVAAAMKLRHQKRVAVAVVGDGGTSRGDFYEAMNLAGVWHLPIVFVINNNQWAISVPASAQTAAQTFAQKGIAAGIRAEQVDGNDVIAVKYCVGEMIERARKGEGPGVIEALSYRMCDHTTADDARRYRETAEIAKHQKEDPLSRMYQYLLSQHLWDEAQDKALREKYSTELLAAIAEYENTPRKTPETMFDYLYETLPEAYVAQYEEAKQLPEMSSKHG